MASPLEHDENGDGMSFSQLDLFLVHDALVCLVPIDKTKKQNLEHLDAMKNLVDRLEKVLKHPESTFSIRPVDALVGYQATQWAYQNYNVFAKLIRIPDDMIDETQAHLKDLTSDLHKYYQACISNDATPKEIIQKLDHEETVAKKGFPREALNDIFSGVSIDSKTASISFSSILSGIAVKSLRFYQSGNGKHIFFNIDSMITGIKYHLEHKTNLPINAQESKHNLKILTDLQKKGLKFVIVDFDKDSLKIKHAHEVSVKDVVKIIDETKTFIKTFFTKE